MEDLVGGDRRDVHRETVRESRHHGVVATVCHDGCTGGKQGRLRDVAFDVNVLGLGAEADRPAARDEDADSG